MSPTPNVELKVAIIRKYGTSLAAAEAFGIHSKTLSLIINGRYFPSEDLKKKIAGKLAAKVEVLFR